MPREYILLPLRDPSIQHLWDDLSVHKTMVCIKHPKMKFTTKNPWSRSVFVIACDPQIARDSFKKQYPHSHDDSSEWTDEYASLIGPMYGYSCTCPEEDLRIRIEKIEENQS